MSTKHILTAASQETVAGESPDRWIFQRAQILFQEYSKALWVQADRRFFWLFLFQWFAGVTLAFVWAPRLLQDTSGSTHIHHWAAIGAGAAIGAIPMIVTWFLQGTVISRQVVAVSQTLFSMLLIHLTAGRMETRFHLFGSLAFLALYRDWRVIATASTVIVAHIFVGVCWNFDALLGTEGSVVNRALQLGGWVLFENTFLLMSISLSLREMWRLGDDRARMEALMNLTISDSKQEADTIMATVNQGLFLLGPNLRIGKNYSKALEDILVSSTLQNQDFLQLLRRLLPESTFATAKDYLTLMFDVNKREKQLTKLNPLKEIEVTLALADGSVVSKHLEFRFNRVLREGKVSHLFVAVGDVTETIRLEQRLKESEEDKEQQLELLLGVLHAEPAALQEFIKATQRSLEASNAALKEENATTEANPRHPAGVDSFRKKLDHVFREIHSIKGNASLLRLQYFEKRAHDIEDKIVVLRKKPALSGEEFLPIVIAQSELSTALESIAGLIERLVNMHRTFGPHRLEGLNSNDHPEGVNGCNDHILRSASALVASLSLKHGKEATFVCDEFEGVNIPSNHREIFNQIIAQLVRNSITHGIETPDERVSSGKERTGRIELHLPSNASGECFEFVFRDDGRGLDSARLESKAVEMGLATFQEMAGWHPSQIVALIFAPGFSTESNATTDAGRGIGMDIIKTRVVDELEGEIRINSAPGQFCEFHIILPN